MKLSTQNSLKVDQDFGWKIATSSKISRVSKNSTPLFEKHLSNDPET